MPWRYRRAGLRPSGYRTVLRYHHKSIKIDYLAEIIPPRHLKTVKRYASLSLMVWILKREVRAFGGCLGMYRR